MKISGKGLCFLMAAALTATGVPARAAEETPSVSARAGIVMEAESGRALWEKNADEPMLIASTTKIMTALVVIERCDLKAAVTVDPAWTGIEGSSMYLKPGQELTVEELLYGLMLASGNDAAAALACVTAGSIPAFAALMNEKAAALGCENTHFENPSGLDSANHYASARDLGRIMAEAIRHEEFCRIVSAVSKTVGEQTYTNHNRLLKECEGVFGGKTGYTMAAGRTLVTCCEREGLRLICVTLSDPDDWRDHRTLYDWAYAEYGRRELLTADSAWTVPVIGGERESVSVAAETALTVLAGPGQEIALELELPGFVYAAVSAGDEAGRATAYIDGREAAAVRLLYAESVSRTEPETPGLWARLGAVFGLGERRIYTLS